MGYIFYFWSLCSAPYIELYMCNSLFKFQNFNFKAVLALPKTAGSAQTHKSISSIELFGALCMYISAPSPLVVFFIK